MLVETEHSIERVVLRAGSKGLQAPLEFAPASVNVFVGPNHSGKSLLLRELQAAIQHPQQAPHRKVLQDLIFTPWSEQQKVSILAELQGAQAAARPSLNNPSSAIQFDSGGKSYEIHKSSWEIFLREFSTLHDIGQINEEVRQHFLRGFFLMLGGKERLDVLNPTKRESPLGRYVHVLSRLFYSDTKRKLTQEIIHDAFKCHFVIDPFGENFEAKISKVAPPPGYERSLADDVVGFFRQSEKIDTMSDGVRAYCGMVAAVVASDARMILIDEPEAFLHPALCIKLARELCKLARANRQQLFIATHSAPFLMGCVQAGIDLNIVRLTYRDSSATSRLLPQQEIIPLMRQPLLRSIGALTGIFYESVAVTEADADRAFYDEVNHRCLTFHHAGEIADCLFLNAQNWQTTARVIAPLRRLGVAAASIVDIDLLLESKSDAFQTLAEAAGIPPATRQSLGQLRGQLHAKLKPIEKSLKKQGVACVTGDDQLDLNNFINQLAQYGVFVVPVGELECWLPNLSRNQWSGKNEWLLRTFEAMGEDAGNSNYLRPSSGDVWDFVTRIRGWFQNPQRLGMPDS
ncbi:MAG: AAA family ATPase [Verrucomicrobia bacterium]|nr:AAA family ATPase [Verrucomicrobiota bacterium]